MNNPASFFSNSDFQDGLIDDLVKLSGNSDEEGIEDYIEKDLTSWIHDNFKTLEDVRDIQYSDYAEHFASVYKKVDEKKVSEAVKNTLKQFKDNCNAICGIGIPAIVITGDESSLPEIFERINNTGERLTKYQVYAATWNKGYIISPKYNTLVDFNKERYDHMNDQGIELSSYDSDDFKNNSSLNLFEICYAFGKKLKKEHEELFGKSTNINSVDSLGFALISSCLGLENKKIDSLQKRVDEKVKDGEIEKLLGKIEESIDLIEAWILKFNKFKLNSKDGTGVGPLHTEFQIVSLVASVFIQEYADVDYDHRDLIIHLDKKNKGWKNTHNAFAHNAYKKYCADILYGRWKGSGDSKLDSTIYDRNYYTSTYKWEDFNRAIISCFSAIDSERKEYKKVENPKEPEKLILSMIYLDSFSAANQVDPSRYDIEHIATKKLMKSKLDQYESLRLPISSIGNICLLPQYENRAKKEKTIYQDKKYLDKSKYSIDDLEKKFTFTNKTDLTWLDNDLNAVEFEAKYREFILNREQKLIDRIKEQYFK